MICHTVANTARLAIFLATSSSILWEPPVLSNLSKLRTGVKTVLTILIASILRLSTCSSSLTEKSIDDGITWTISTIETTVNAVPILAVPKVLTILVSSCSSNGDVELTSLRFTLVCLTVPPEATLRRSGT